MDRSFDLWGRTKQEAEPPSSLLRTDRTWTGCVRGIVTHRGVAGWSLTRYPVDQC